jgi:hypothetical protein
MWTANLMEGFPSNGLDKKQVSCWFRHLDEFSSTYSGVESGGRTGARCGHHGAT